MIDDEIARAEAALNMLRKALESNSSRSLQSGKEWRKAYRSRQEYFPKIAFSDPYWDIISFLAEQRRSECTSFVKSIVHSTNSPQTTVLRHLRQLEDQGQIQRSVDPDDSRRTIVQIKDGAFESYCNWTRNFD